VLEPAYTSASFADKNAGSGKYVTVSGIAVSGTDAGNYVVTQATGAQADITPRPLTVSAAGVDKVYDGTTDATVILSDNRITGDSLTDSYVTASFADKNVGSGKTVSAIGIAIAGGDASNYTLTSTTASTSANITPAPLAVTPNANQKKFFGASDPTLSYTVTAGHLMAGDGFSGALGRDPGEAVGNYMIRQGALTAGGNYALTFIAGNQFGIVYNDKVGHQFLQPISLTTRSSFRSGSTIPVKFQLFMADGITPVTNAVATVSVTYLSPLTTSATNDDVLVMTPDPGVTFRYDPMSQQYIFNLGTSKSWSGTYQVTANLNDGHVVTAQVELRTK
jgi:YDG domain/MBG domain (YGX type)